MPLTHVRWRQGRNENVATVAEFLDLAAKDPMFPVPYPVARAMLEEDLTRPADGLSVTSLLSGCLSCKVLQKHIDFTVTVPDDVFYRWKGSMFHMVFEHYQQEGAFGETRLWAPVPGHGEMRVHGKFDLVVPSRLLNGAPAVLVDGKTTKQVPMYGDVWPNHEQQLNIYRWLINNASGHDGSLTDEEFAELVSQQFGHLVIWYIDNDRIKVIETTKTEMVPTKSGAKSPFKKVKTPHQWSDEEVEGFLAGQFEDLAEAYAVYEEFGTLPPYPPDFDWMNGWEHRYSPVATQCVLRHLAQGDLDERQVAA